MDDAYPAAEQLPITVTVNGHVRQLQVAVHQALLDALREDLSLTGTKTCCLVGECGACTVMLNGRSVDSCLVLAVEADGGSVTTVEGIAANGRLSAVQQAFLDEGAAQCGFCIPGQVVSAHALLAHNAHPTREQVEEALAGNYCRCAGYPQIIEAVLAAAKGTTSELAGAPVPPPATDPAATPDASVAPQ